MIRLTSFLRVWFQCVCLLMPSCNTYHLTWAWGISYLGRGVSLHGCSSKAQPLFLTLDEGYLLTTALPDLQPGMAPLGPPVPTQPLLLGCGVAPPGRSPCLLRNLYAGQEAAVRTGHGTTDWFQIGEGVRQGCILSPCLFLCRVHHEKRWAG